MSDGGVLEGHQETGNWGDHSHTQTGDRRECYNKLPFLSLIFWEKCKPSGERGMLNRWVS